MNDKSETAIRIIVFNDGGAWVAQCLEYDICAQADDLEELRDRIDATIEAERDYTRSKGKEAFEGIGPAPKHFADMWEKRSSFTSRATDHGMVELALCA